MNRKFVLSLVAALIAGIISSYAQHAVSVFAQEKPRIAKFQAAEGNPQSSDIKQAELNYAQARGKSPKPTWPKCRKPTARYPTRFQTPLSAASKWKSPKHKGAATPCLEMRKDSLENPYVALAKQSVEFAEQNLKAGQ